MVTTRRQQFETQALGELDCLYGAALRLTRNRADAEDLVQETFLKAYAAWDRFLPGSSCRAWMRCILENTFISGFRRRRSHRKFVSRPGDEPVTALYGEETRGRTENPEAAYVEDRLGDEVTAALAELPVEQRAVVALADVEGLRYSEIARRLRIPLGTVMSRLFRARRLLEGRLASFAAREYGIARRAA